MGKEWLWWLGEFGLAATVAVVAGFVTRDVPISILYGLFVGTVFFVLKEHRRVVSQHERQVFEMKNEALNLPPTFTHLEIIDPNMRHLIERERSELLRLSKEVAEGKILLRSRPMWQIMNDFRKLAKPGDRVIATNTGGHHGRIPNWEIVLQTDFELADNGVDFTRIFIEPTNATPEFKKRLRQQMDHQKEHIKVRFIKESKLPTGVKQNSLLMVDKYCGSLIFGTGSSLKLPVVEEMQITVNQEELEKIKETMELVIKLSEEYK
jgi:hypothetical protein